MMIETPQQKLSFHCSNGQYLRQAAEHNKQEQLTKHYSLYIFSSRIELVVNIQDGMKMTQFLPPIKQVKKCHKEACIPLRTTLSS
jgi:ferredoxin-NADP reductase